MSEETFPGDDVMTTLVDDDGEMGIASLDVIDATETGVGDFIEGGGYPDVVVCAFDDFTSDFTSDFSLELELLLLSAEH